LNMTVQSLVSNLKFLPPIVSFMKSEDLSISFPHSANYFVIHGEPYNVNTE
jgi:hypothetical protein